MSSQTKSEILAENLALRRRLAQLEAASAMRREGGSQTSDAPDDIRFSVEEALKVSEARYRRLFETAKDGILILDADSGRISDSNPFLEQMLGYSHQDLAGKQLWDIGSFKDIAASQTAYQELLKQEYIRYEDLPLESKNGDRLQVEFISNLYLVAHSRVIQCNIRDITARKLAEARTQQALDRLSSLVKTLRRRDSQMSMLNRLNELLQTCETQDEAYRVIGVTASELFGDQGGCIAVLHPSGHMLETVARWGDGNHVETIFPVEDCWAMRRGRAHEVRDPHASLFCSHFVRLPEAGYLCLPLTVQGEILGMFHVNSGPSIDEDEMVGRYQMAVTAGEAIKLSLANLKLRKKLHEQATRDPLTGLFNRRYLEDTLPREIHRSLRRKSTLCLAMLDLDNFKRLNDTYGHEAGDVVLREWGRVLRESLRMSDIACRFGGEEFVIVLPDSTLSDASQRIDDVRVLFENLEIRYEDRLLSTTTLSAGVAASPEHASTTEDLLRAADKALYTAKQEGRNRVVAYRVSG